MPLRRILYTACLGALVLVGVPACGGGDGKSPNGADASATSSTPTTATSNTAALCATLTAAMASGQARLLQPDNTVATATGVLTDWSTALRAAAPQATDAQFTLALTSLADELDTVKTKVLTAQNLNDWGILMSGPEVSTALHNFDAFCPLR